MNTHEQQVDENWEFNAPKFVSFHNFDAANMSGDEWFDTHRESIGSFVNQSSSPSDNAADAQSCLSRALDMIDGLNVLSVTGINSEPPEHAVMVSESSTRIAHGTPSIVITTQTSPDSTYIQEARDGDGGSTLNLIQFSPSPYHVNPGIQHASGNWCTISTINGQQKENVLPNGGAQPGSAACGPHKFSASSSRKRVADVSQVQLAARSIVIKSRRLSMRKMSSDAAASANSTEKTTTQRQNIRPQLKRQVSALRMPNLEHITSSFAVTMPKTPNTLKRRVSSTVKKPTQSQPSEPAKVENLKNAFAEQLRKNRLRTVGSKGVALHVTKKLAIPRTLPPISETDTASSMNSHATKPSARPCSTPPVVASVSKSRRRSFSEGSASVFTTPSSSTASVSVVSGEGVPGSNNSTLRDNAAESTFTSQDSERRSFLKRKSTAFIGLSELNRPPPLTQPSGPKFQVDARLEARVARRSMMTTTNSSEDQEDNGVAGVIKFYRPAPKFGHPFVPSKDSKRLTEQKPFTFQEKLEQQRKEKERWRQKQLEEQYKVPEFHANPIFKPTVPMKKTEIPKVEIQPFNLKTELRGHVNQQKLQEKLKQEQEDAERKRQFKARPPSVLHQEPFQVVHPEHEPVIAAAGEPLFVHTQIRAKERAQYQAERAERKAAEEEKKTETENAMKQFEEAEMRRRRQEDMVHRAQPIRQYMPLPPASKVPITVPTSPFVARKREDTDDNEQRN